VPQVSAVSKAQQPTATRDHGLGRAAREVRQHAWGVAGFALDHRPLFNHRYERQPPTALRTGDR